MANWATTDYAITGDEHEVNLLYRIMDALQSMPRPFEENGWGSCWLGCLVSVLGGDTNKIYCRGQWNGDASISGSGDDAVLRFSTETAWGRCSEVDDLIRKKFKHVRIYFIEEEPGMNIYQTNDFDNRFFSDEVRVYFEDGDDGYLSRDDAMKSIAAALGTKGFASWEECRARVEKHNAKCDEDNTDNRIYITELEYINC